MIDPPKPAQTIDQRRKRVPYTEGELKGLRQRNLCLAVVMVVWAVAWSTPQVIRMLTPPSAARVAELCVERADGLYGESVRLLCEQAGIAALDEWTGPNRRPKLAMTDE